MMFKTHCSNNPAQNRDAAGRTVNLPVRQHRTAMLSSLMEFMRLLIFALILVQSAAAATLSAGYTIGSGLLGNSLFIDSSVTGGGDSSSGTGDLGWTAELAGLWTSNSSVILSGIALPIWSDANNTTTTVSGTFTFYFYDLDKGANPNAFDGTGVESLVGTATASFTQGAIGTYYAVFDSPVRFTARSTGVAVRIVNTGWLRLKINTAPGGVLKNSTTGAAIGGTNPDFRITLAGLAYIPPAFAPRVNLAKYQTVITDSTNGQNLASYVTDGVVGDANLWQSAGYAPHWAEVVFPFPVQVGSAQIFSGYDDGYYMTSCNLQYLTNSTWVNVPGGTVSVNTNVECNVVFSAPVTSTAFRLYDSADGTIRVKELALYPPNGTNGFAVGTDVTLDLARERPALATSNTAGNYAQNAVDGYVDDTSMWQTALAGSNSLMIDLRVNTKIGSAHLYSGSAGIPPLTNFVLCYWNGSAWQNIPGGSVSGNTNPVCVVPFAADVVTSNVLLVSTNTSVTSIKELCVFAANNNNGYAAGTGVITGPPPTAQFDDYNDAYYNLKNQAANLAMAVSGGVPGLAQPGLTNAQSEYQILLNISTGTYRLRNRATGQCLSGAQLSTNAGALLVDEPYSALPDQDWILQPVDGTHYQLVNQWSGLAVDTQGEGTAPGTPLVQNSINGSVSQNWALVYAEHYPKKGMDGGGWVSNPSTLDGNWCYDWGLNNTAAPTLPAGVVYDPMQWGNYNWDLGSSAGPLWQYYPQWRTQAKTMHCLGFNEPDNNTQSNINSNTAVALWPRLQAMDVPLVSPAPANLTGGWLAYFYNQATNLGYRVDYTAVHTYPSPSSGSSDGLVSTLQTGYTNWGRPVWLTEFSFVDWNTPDTGTWTEEDNYNCLAEFLWRAEGLTWLRHYGLFIFTADTNNPVPPLPWSTVGPRSNTFDTNGNFTPFGQLYAAWDGDANVETNKAYFIHNSGTRKRLQNTLGATANATDIRASDVLVQWTLQPVPSSSQYYIVSSLDGRRLTYVNGGSVSLVAAGTTGSAVQWQLTPYQYGWFYLDHPATSKRLQLAFNNTTSVSTFSMVANTTTTTAVQWRFIVPLTPTPSVWTGASNASWLNTNNWVAGNTPSATESVTFNSLSTAHLATVLNSNYDVFAISLTTPAGPVSIGGANTLTVGSGGIDLSGASQNLTVTTPLVLGAIQSWIVASGATLSVNGGMSGNGAVTIAGGGIVSLGGASTPATQPSSPAPHSRWQRPMFCPVGPGSAM